MGTSTNKLRWYYAGIAAFTVAVAAILGWATATLGPEPPPDPQLPSAREYLDYTACLLTSDRGLADPAAVPAWAGLQEASLATHAKVQYLAIAGRQTPDNAATFLNTLAQTGCQTIYAAGDLPTQTVIDAAARFPTITFHPITSQPVTAVNLEPINDTEPDAVRQSVAASLTEAVAAVQP